MHATPVLAVLLAASLSGASPTAPQSAGPDRAAMAEDVEVLRRLLVRQLEPTARPERVALPGEYDPSHLLHGYTLSGTASSRSPVVRSRGWYVPGTGVFFAIDLEVPVRRAQRPEGAANGGEEPDLWERTEREVRGQGPRTAFDRSPVLHADANQTLYWRLQSAQGVALELDEAAVRRATDSVLEALLDHGARLEGLAPGETITVALHVGGTGSPSFTVPTTTGDDDAAVYWNQLFLESSTARVPPRHVVVQVARDDLRELQRGDALRDDVRARALVESY